MKKIFFFSVLSSTFSFGQTKDSVKVPTQHKLLVSTFIETQMYTPMKTNTFDMVYKFSAGTVGQIKISKKLSAMVGLRIWQNAAEKYALSSRSWVQSGFHGAVAVLYTTQIKQGHVSIGPALVKFSYTLSGLPVWHDNQKFQELTKTVLDTVSGARGNYYTAPYLFVRYQKRTARSVFEGELNIIIPGTWPDPVASWQPRGSLVHAIRTKIQFEKKRFSCKTDIQIPTIAGLRSIGYKNLLPREITGKLELGYSFTLTGGTIKIVSGYERDWHALNFPLLLKGQSGTWGAPYVGIRFESVMKK